MPICKRSHRYWAVLDELPDDQGGDGRHRCAGCAYELGLAAGRAGGAVLEFDPASLDFSQAGTARHKSPTAAWALGYVHGVMEE